MCVEEDVKLNRRCLPWYGFPSIDDLDLILPNRLPEITRHRDLHFRIPQQFIKQARKGPPYYKNIGRSIWIRDVKEHPEEITTACSCKERCLSGIKEELF